MSKEDELREIALRELAEEEIAQEDAQEPIGQAEAFGLGVVEGVPFAKDAIAATEELPLDVSQPFITSAEVADQVQSTMDEQALGTFTDRARKNKADWDDAINRAEEQHPFTFTAGDITGGVATGIATGGTGMAAAAGFGAVEGLSRSEDRSIEDVIAGAALGTAGFGVAKGIGKGLNFVGKRIGIFADKGVVEATGALNKSKVKKVKNHIVKFYTSKGDDSAKSTAKFADEVLDMRTPEGKPFLETIQNFEETATKAAELKGMYGKAMGDVLKEVDEVIPKVDTSALHNKLSQDIVEPLRKINDPNALKLADDFQRRIDAQFREPVEETMKEVLNKEGVPVMLKEATGGKFKDLKLSQLHELKQFLAKEVRNSFDKSSGQLPQNAIELKKHVGITTDYIDELIEGSGVDIPQAKTFKDLKRKWATANLVEEMAEDESASRLGGPMGALMKAFSVRGIAIGAIQKVSQVPTAVAATTAIALNEVLASGTTPAVLATSLQTLSKHITANPDSKYLKRLITASTLSSDSMREAVASSVAEINLASSPVQRTVESAKQKRSSILAALEYENKELAGQLSDAFDRNDGAAIGGIMDGLSKSNPDLIEQGIGWDGKVYSPEDKASLEQEIRRADLPASQEIILLEELNQQNTIPNIQPVQPFQRTFTPRDKDTHGY